MKKINAPASLKQVVSKNRSKSTSAKAVSLKSKTGSSQLSTLKKKINWKIAAAVIIIFALAFGYLLVRLSEASKDSSQWLAGTPAFGINGGSIKDKDGGRKAWVASKGNYAAVIDQEYIATRGNQIYCFSPRQETDANVLMRFTITSSAGRVSATDAWSNGKGNQMLVCTTIERELDNNISRVARLDIIDGGGAVAVFSIGRSLVPGTYVDFPTPAPPPPVVPSAPTPSSNDVPANQVYEDCPNYTIAKGNANECVGFAQNLLNTALRLSGTARLDIDKIYGDKMVATVKQFQGTANKNADGIIGPNTWTALINRYKEVISAQPTAAPAATPAPSNPSSKTTLDQGTIETIQSTAQDRANRSAELYNSTDGWKYEVDIYVPGKSSIWLCLDSRVSNTSSVYKNADYARTYTFSLYSSFYNTRSDFSVGIPAKKATNGSTTKCIETTWKNYNDAARTVKVGHVIPQYKPFQAVSHPDNTCFLLWCSTDLWHDAKKVYVETRTW
ncbi:peptidoglycan-binding protein [Candidatus Saccharibacteria bacterium]|nr:peptidoglycan-binding protein [Candidatus Saccharibacteria bacterium]